MSLENKLLWWSVLAIKADVTTYSIVRALNMSKIILSCKATKSIQQMLTALVGLYTTYLATVGYIKSVVPNLFVAADR